MIKPPEVRGVGSPELGSRARLTPVPKKAGESVPYTLADDGTGQLLRWGSTIMGVGVVALVLLLTALGGVGVEGARSNSGWLALIIGMMCLPFGLLLTLLGAAKWLRRRGIKKELRERQSSR
jgi:hypothetical protein